MLNPSLARHAFGNGAAVAGEHPHIEAHGPQSGDGGGGLGFDGVGDFETARRRAIHRHRDSRPARLHLPPVHAGLHAVTGRGRKLSRLGQRDAATGRRFHHGFAQRVFGVTLGAGGEAQQLAFAEARGRKDGSYDRLAVRERAGFIEHHGIDAICHFERFAAFNEDASLGTAPGADHDGGGRGQPQRARAGDNQHRYRVHHGRSKRPEQNPHPEGEGRGRQHAQREVAAHHVRQPRHRRARPLRLAHHFDHPAQHGAASHLGGREAEAAGTVEGARINRAARALLNRHALAGEHGFVDGRFARHDGAIHRNAFARPHHHRVAEAHFRHRDFDFRAVAQDAGVGRLQIHQPPNGCAGLGARPRLQQPACQDERDDGGGSFKVDFVAAARGLVNRIQECGTGAQRNQRIHVGRVVPQRGPRRRVESGARIQHHRQRHRQLHPGPAVHHAERHHRQREAGGNDQTAAIEQFGRRARVAFGHAVAQILDGADEIAHLGARRIVLHRGGLGRQVDAGARDARGSRESQLNRAGASGAGHAAHRQVDTLRRGDAHAPTS